MRKRGGEATASAMRVAEAKRGGSALDAGAAGAESHPSTGQIGARSRRVAICSKRRSVNGLGRTGEGAPAEPGAPSGVQLSQWSRRGSC
jgi:hypothetical protein